MSLYTSSYSPFLKAPISITISSSTAPLAYASIASATLENVVCAPDGNPITVPIFTSLPSRTSRAISKLQGLIQTDAQWLSFAY